MRNLSKTPLIFLFVFVLLLFTNSGQAVQCVSFVGKKLGPDPIKGSHARIYKAAERYAAKKQKSNSYLQLGKRFYRSVTKLLLIRNVKPIEFDEEGNPVLAVGRISDESSRHVNDLVIQLRSLLDQSLITDVDILNSNQALKEDRAKLVLINEKLVELESELAKLRSERGSMESATGEESGVVLSTGEQANYEKQLQQRNEVVEVKEQEVLTLTTERDGLEADLAARKEELNKRIKLRQELVRGIKGDVARYDSLPSRIKAITKRIEVRAQRIRILKKVESLTLQTVSLPEFVDGKVIWKDQRYDRQLARTAVHRLNQQIKSRVLKKQIRALLYEQAEIHMRLKISVAYFLDAQEHSPETFGPPKQKLLLLMVTALEKIENSPGYSALKGFERKIFIEEFMETFDLSAEGIKPREALINRLVEEAGAVRSNLQEATGAVQNSIMKKARAFITGLVATSTLTGASFMGIPDGTGDVVKDSIGGGVSILSEQVSSLLFQLDSLTGFYSTAGKLAEVPEADRAAWLMELVEANGIDVTTQSGAALIKELVNEAQMINMGREAVKAEIERAHAERQGAIDEILNEDN